MWAVCLDGPSAGPLPKMENMTLEIVHVRQYMAQVAWVTVQAGTPVRESSIRRISAHSPYIPWFCDTPARFVRCEPSLDGHQPGTSTGVLTSRRRSPPSRSREILREAPQAPQHSRKRVGRGATVSGYVS